MHHDVRMFQHFITLGLGQKWMPLTCWRWHAFDNYICFWFFCTVLSDRLATHISDCRWSAHSRTPMWQIYIRNNNNDGRCFWVQNHVVVMKNRFFFLLWLRRRLQVRWMLNMMMMISEWAFGWGCHGVDRWNGRLEIWSEFLWWAKVKISVGFWRRWDDRYSIVKCQQLNKWKMIAVSERSRRRRRSTPDVHWSICWEIAR